MLRLYIFACLLHGIACMVATPSAKIPATTTYSSLANLVHDEAAAGDVDAVNLLLQSGFDCNARNELESTPLHMAVLNGHTAIAEVLLDNGALVNAANQDGNKNNARI